MRNITCQIIDDEPLAVKLLETFVERTPFLSLAASYTDPVEALAALKINPVDLIFLDIQMPHIDGMELSRMIPKETRIIFTTAFKDYAVESYEVSALDFLLKPIHYSKFVASVDKAREWFEMTQSKSHDTQLNSIFVKVDGMMKQLDLKRIEYICGMKDYINIYLSDEKRPLVTHITMKVMEDVLPKDSFMRVHRSYIVAMDKIKAVDRNNCIYIGNEVIHISDGYIEAFTAYINAHSLNSSRP